MSPCLNEFVNQQNRLTKVKVRSKVNKF